MQVALYGRISKDNSKQDTENQLHELRQFCRRSRWTVVHEYVDRMSGKTANRPQFEKLFNDASKGKVDLVLFWALDRFTREGTLATLKHLEMLSGYGVDWRSYQESYLDSCGPFKDVVISLMATLAKQERIRISERTIAGLNRARRQGKTLGRPQIVTDRQKVRDLRRSGMSLGAIAQKLRLSKTTVARIVKRA
jgi:DNA invertase Pin-like site-specific DNA recombinase